MPKIGTEDANGIAAKLHSNAPERPGRSSFTVTMTAGRKHDIVKVYYGQTFVSQYGIQRSSKLKGHNYVAAQLHLTLTQAYEPGEVPLQRGRLYRRA